MKTRTGFTLIELLAVLFIIALVVGITVAGYTSISRNAAIDGATYELRTKLMLAKQYAVTKRVPVAFLVLDPRFFTPDYPMVSGYERLNGRSYAIYDLKNKSYIQTWMELPDGIIWDNTTESPNTAEGVNILLADERRDMNVKDHVLRKIPFPANGHVLLPDAEFYGIVFQPTGRTLKPASGWSHWLFIREGAVDARGIVTSAGKPGVGIQVSYPGRVKVVRAAASQG